MQGKCHPRKGLEYQVRLNEVYNNTLAKSTYKSLSTPKVLGVIFDELKSKNSLDALLSYKKTVCSKYAYFWFHPAWGDELKRGFKAREEQIRSLGS
jgi:hypothetical protein